MLTCWCGVLSKWTDLGSESSSHGGHGGRCGHWGANKRSTKSLFSVQPLPQHFGISVGFTGFRTLGFPKTYLIKQASFKTSAGLPLLMKLPSYGDTSWVISMSISTEHIFGCYFVPILVYAEIPSKKGSPTNLPKPILVKNFPSIPWMSKLYKIT